MKSHLIHYSKIYENFDLDDIRMDVKNKEKNRTIGSFEDMSSSYSEIIIDDNNKQDALIIEYCPKIFNELRKIDDISNIELEK